MGRKIWYFVGYERFVDVVIEVVDRLGVGSSVVGVQSVVSVIGTDEYTACDRRNDEPLVALYPLDGIVPLAEAGNELFGRHCLFLVDDGVKDLLDGSRLDDMVDTSGVVGRHDDFLREVFIIDVESKLALVITRNPSDTCDDVGVASIDDTKNVGADSEEAFSYLADGILVFSHDVVSDTKQ